MWVSFFAIFSANIYVFLLLSFRLLDSRKVLAKEFTEIVGYFIQNMLTIKTAMTLKHEKERKKFLINYMKDPRRKYEEHATTDTAPTEEELYLNISRDGTEAEC